MCTTTLKLLNTVHCRHNNYSLDLAWPWNTICEDWCNTDQITFSVEVDQIQNSDALNQLLSICSCIKCYERDGEERVFNVTCDNTTGKWSYENKCHLVKCKNPPEIELGMGTLLETAPQYIVDNG